MIGHDTLIYLDEIVPPLSLLPSSSLYFLFLVGTLYTVFSLLTIGGEKGVLSPNIKNGLHVNVNFLVS